MGLKLNASGSHLTGAVICFNEPGSLNETLHLSFRSGAAKSLKVPLKAWRGVCDFWSQVSERFRNTCFTPSQKLRSVIWLINSGCDWPSAVISTQQGRLVIAPKKVQRHATRTSSDKCEEGSEVSRESLSLLVAEWWHYLQHTSLECSLESFAAGRGGCYMYLGSVFTESSPWNYRTNLL